jgi:NADH:ubiquinone oxidoreductase subunit 3 (subunit A)
MPGSDVALFCFIYLQPSVLAIILASIVYRGLSIAPYFNWFVGSKHRRKGVRFFECAARPRLLALFTYEVPFLTFCALFILYDADLMFFLPEVIAGEY